MRIDRFDDRSSDKAGRPYDALVDLDIADLSCAFHLEHERLAILLPFKGRTQFGQRGYSFAVDLIDNVAREQIAPRTGGRHGEAGDQDAIERRGDPGKSSAIDASMGIARIERRGTRCWRSLPGTQSVPGQVDPRPTRLSFFSRVSARATICIVAILERRCWYRFT